MPNPVSLAIAESLELFLSRGSITNMHIAAGSTYPPQLAYLVSLPRLFVVLSGEDQMEMDCDDQPRQFAIKAGDVVLIPANCWNKPAWSRRVKVLTLLLDKSILGINLLDQHRKCELIKSFETHLHYPPNSPMTGIVDAMLQLPIHVPVAPVDCLLTEALLYSCLKLLREPAVQQSSKADKTFHNIAMYLLENYHFPLTRESVADHFGLSPNHVSRLFRTEASTRFIDYLTEVRLDRAKYLLRHHDQTLGEIAVSCGFSDVGYFCRVFKQRAKITPTAYRLDESSEG